MIFHRVWPLCGALAVAAVWVVSALANYRAGLALAADPDMSQILGAASVACDVLKAVTLFIVLGCLWHRRWVALSVAFVLFVLATGWSLRSAMYFAADSIMTAQIERSQQNEIQDQTLALIDAKQRRVAFLAEQKVDVTGGPKTRTVSLEANQATAAEFAAIVNEIKQDIAAVASTPPIRPRDPLANLFDIADKQLAFLTSISFALLLELASGAGFWLIARAKIQDPDRPAVVQAQLTPPSPPPSSAEPDERGAGEVVSEPDGFGEGGFGTPRMLNAERETSTAEPGRIVDLELRRDEVRVAMALRQALDFGGDDDRVLLAVVQDAVNRQLPRNKRLTSTHQTKTLLVPVMEQVFPKSERRRAGGKTWAYGVRLREAAESVTMNG